MSFTLPELAYPVQSLEPNIDTKTMEIHHGKHHAAYVTNVNNAIKDTPMDRRMLDVDLTPITMGKIKSKGLKPYYINT